MPNYNTNYAGLLYDDLRDAGYTGDEIGTKDQFIDLMSDEGHRRVMYNNLNKQKKYGKLPSYDAYEQLLTSDKPMYSYDWNTGTYSWENENEQEEPAVETQPNDTTQSTVVNAVRPPRSDAPQSAMSVGNRYQPQIGGGGKPLSDAFNKTLDKRRVAGGTLPPMPVVQQQEEEQPTSRQQAVNEWAENNTAEIQQNVDNYLNERNRPLNPEAPGASMTVGQWNDMVDAARFNTANMFSGKYVEEMSALADEASNAAWERYAERNANNPWAYSQGDVFFNTQQANVARGQIEDAAWNDVQMAQLKNEYSNAVRSIIDSEDFQKQVTEDAKRLGYDRDFYETKVIDALNSTYLDTLHDKLVRANMPENTIQYVMAGIQSSIIGGAMSRLSGTQGQWQRREEGLQLYESEKNPNVFARAGHVAVGFATDAPIFQGIGAAVGTGMNAYRGWRVMRLAARTGKSRAGVERAAQMYLNSNFGARIGSYVTNNMIQSGATLGVYNGLSTAANQAMAGYYDPMEIAKQAGQGVVFGGILGMFSGVGNEIGSRVLGSATANSSKIGRIFKSGVAEAAKYGTEATAFTLGEQVGQLISGEGLKPWDEAVANGVVMPLVLKLSNPSGLREVRKAYDYAFNPERYNKENYRGESFTKDEQQRIMQSVGGKNFFDALNRIEKMFGRDITPEERGRILSDANYYEQRSLLAQAYTDLMNDPTIDFVTKQKLAVLGGGVLAVKMPAAAGVDGTWDVDTGRGEAVVYDAEGGRIESKTFTSEDALNKWIVERTKVVQAEQEAAAGNIQLEPTSWNMTYLDMRRRGMTFGQLQESQQRIQSFVEAQQAYRQARDANLALEQRLRDGDLTAEEEEEIRETIGQNEGVADRAADAMARIREEFTDNDKAVLYRWADYTMERKAQVYDRMKAIENHIDDITNDDMGQVVYATLKAGKEKVYVVAGRISSAENGTVDKEGTDDTLVVADRNGNNKRMVSSDEIATVDEVVEPIEELGAAEQQVEMEVDGELEQQASVPRTTTEEEAPIEEETPAEIPTREGEPVYNEGDELTLNIDGEEQMVTVLSVDGDGNVEVYDPVGDETVTLTPEQLSDYMVQKEAPEENAPTAEENPKAEESALDYVRSQGGYDAMIGEENGADIAYDAMIEETQGDEDMALDVAKDMLKDAEKALDKAKKATPRGGNTVSEKIKARKEVADDIAEKQTAVDFWNEVVNTPNRRAEQGATDVGVSNGEVAPQEETPTLSQGEPEQTAMGVEKVVEDNIASDNELLQGLVGKTFEDEYGRKHIITSIIGKHYKFKQNSKNAKYEYAADLIPMLDGLLAGKNKVVGSKAEQDEVAALMETRRKRALDLAQRLANDKTLLVENGWGNFRVKDVNPSNNTVVYELENEDRPRRYSIMDLYNDLLSHHIRPVRYTLSEDGEYVEYDKDGKMRTHGWYKDGKKTGVWEEYDKQGNLSIRYNKYKDGKIDGVVEEIGADGRPYSVCTYKNGEILEERDWHIDDDGNEYVEITTWDDDEEPHVRTEYLSEDRSEQQRGEQQEDEVVKAHDERLASVQGKERNALGLLPLYDVEGKDILPQERLEQTVAQATKDMQTLSQRLKEDLGIKEEDIKRERKRGNAITSPLKKRFRVPLNEGEFSAGRMMIRLPLNSDKDRLVVWLNFDIDHEGRLFFTDATAFRSIDDNTVGERTRISEPTYEKVLETLKSKLDKEEQPEPSTKEAAETTAGEMLEKSDEEEQNKGQREAKEEYDWGSYDEKSAKKDLNEISNRLKKELGLKKVTEAEFVEGAGALHSLHFMGSLDNDNHKGIGVTIRLENTVDGGLKPESIRVEVANDFTYAMVNKLPPTLGISSKKIKDNKFSYADVKGEVEKALKDAATGGNNVKEWINSILSPQEKMEEKPKEKAVESVGAESFAGYSIEPKDYTTKKGKVLNMHLVKFDDELTKEQASAASKFAKENKGWYDRTGKGYMMRSKDDARKLADVVKDVEEAPETTSSPIKEAEKYVNDHIVIGAPGFTPKGTKKPTMRQVDVVGLMDELKTKGEAKFSDHYINEEPSEEKGEEKKEEKNDNGFVFSDDDYEELKKRWKAKRKNLNSGFDPELFDIGIKMAFYHIERGVRKFREFCEKMIEELGETVRPYLKSMYKGAHQMAKDMGLGFADDMTSDAEVDKFDVANFDKEHRDVLDTAAHIDAEQKAERSSTDIKRRAAELIKTSFYGDKIYLKDGRGVTVINENWRSGTTDEPELASLNVAGDDNKVFTISPDDIDIERTEAEKQGVDGRESDTNVEMNNLITASYRPTRPMDYRSEEYKSDIEAQMRPNLERVAQQLIEDLQIPEENLEAQKDYAAFTPILGIDFNEPNGSQYKGNSYATITLPLGEANEKKAGYDCDLVIEIPYDGLRNASQGIDFTGTRPINVKVKYVKGRGAGFISSGTGHQVDLIKEGYTGIVKAAKKAISEDAPNFIPREEKANEAPQGDNLLFNERYPMIKGEDIYDECKRVAKELRPKVKDTINGIIKDLGVEDYQKGEPEIREYTVEGISFSTEFPVGKNRLLYLTFNFRSESPNGEHYFDFYSSGIELLERMNAMMLEKLGDGVVTSNLTYDDYLQRVKKVIGDKVPEIKPSEEKQDETANVAGALGMPTFYKVEPVGKWWNNAKKEMNAGANKLAARLIADLDVPEKTIEAFLKKSRYNNVVEVEFPSPSSGEVHMVIPFDENGDNRLYLWFDYLEDERGEYHLGTVYVRRYEGEESGENYSLPRKGGFTYENLLQNVRKALQGVKETKYLDNIERKTGEKISENEKKNVSSQNLNNQQDNANRRTNAVRPGGLQERLRSNNETVDSRRGSEASGQDSGRNDRRGEEGGVSHVRRSLHDGPRHVRNQDNVILERDRDYAPRGVDNRIEANIAAIELSHKIEEEKRSATPAEKQVLLKYSGWGGLGKAFSEPDWSHSNPYYQRVKDLFDDDSYQEAVMSSNTGYYSGALLGDTIWDIFSIVNPQGGKFLESSAGKGDLIGRMPANIRDNVEIMAVEIDKTTALILSQLYPDATVYAQGFETVKIRNGSIDKSSTNVPFGDIRVFDTTGDNDLAKKFPKIHDFCIAKNVRKLREGGLGIFITTSGTLDNSQTLRDWVVSSSEGDADFIGAFRLNNATFEGTKVTADILVIRKRVNSEKSPYAIDVSDIGILRTVEYNTGKTRKNRKTGEEEDVVKPLALTINKYFIEHPERVGGDIKFAFENGETWRPESIGCYPERDVSQKERLKDWVDSFRGKDYSAATNEMPIEGSTDNVYEQLGEDAKEGGLILNSNRELCIVSYGIAVPLDVNKNKVKGHTKEECFTSYSNIKDALADVLKFQTENEGNDGLKPLLNKLNKAYDDFVETYGHFTKNTAISFLKNDIDYSTIAALETVKEYNDKQGNRQIKYGKTDVFKGRVVEKEIQPKPTNVTEGVTTSIYQFGKIDIPYIAEQLGRSEDDVRREILDNELGYENPTTLQIEVSFDYLSGNVRDKLYLAQENNEDGIYNKNIKALEKVIPANIPAHLIEFTLGSSWIDPQMYVDFIKDKTDINVTVVNAGGQWVVTASKWKNEPKNRELSVYSEVCEKRIWGDELIAAAMQYRTIDVSKTDTTKDSDGKKHSETIRDKEATQACLDKMAELREEFKDWARDKMQTDGELSQRMEKVYNDLFNNYVPRKISDNYTPTHFIGANSKVTMRPHQAKAAVLSTMQNLLYAHEVGTGKTYTIITAAMEMRRLGTAKKPMIVVQNATTEQFVEKAKFLYPNAKVLTLESSDKGAEGRKAFYAKIKYNDWDMIIIPQSVFDMIDDSPERKLAYINSIIEERLYALEQMRQADVDEYVLRAAENEIDRLRASMADVSNGEEEGEDRQAKKSDSKRTEKTKQNARARAQQRLDRKVDEVTNFDEMGIDALFVDEAHFYKHLGFGTVMQRGVKGVDSSYSKRSQGLYLKTRSVMEKTGGKNVIFATGTPITNTAAELWTFMRYLYPEDTLKAYNIFYFDDFVRIFGNVQQVLEFTTSGKFKEANRFAGYINIPELIRIFSGIADIKLARDIDDLQEHLPDIETGKAINIYVEQNPAFRQVMKFVRSELERYEKMEGREKALPQNRSIPLRMYGIAKAAAIDPRLVLDDAQDMPNSKTNAAVKETLKSLEETKGFQGTVAIFADTFQNKRTGFNLFEEIKRKLIENGVPAEQIAIIDSKLSAEKKMKIFEKVNSGEIRVIMGSTATLGTGVNIQERLHCLIHIDAPNRPSDYKQRNGRGVRQDNILKAMGIPVRVICFGMRDSLDVTVYQRLATKERFIDSIMRGNQYIDNSMENRTIEEEEDVFGDTVAQLSGSEYALLKNQAERDVRKYEAKEKQYISDQTYIHNRIPSLEKSLKYYSKSIEDNRNALKKVEKLKDKSITIKNKKFADIDEMADFFKDYNKKGEEIKERVRSLWSNSKVEQKITINVGGFDFDVVTEFRKDTESLNGGMTTVIRRKTTFSCEELNVKDEQVKGGYLKGAVESIVNDFLSGRVFEEGVARAERQIESAEKELSSLKKREGKPFENAKELAAAREHLADMTEKMQAELKEKEAKYKEMDEEVGNIDVSDITEAEEEEDTDEVFREGDNGYSGNYVDEHDEMVNTVYNLADELGLDNVGTIEDVSKLPKSQRTKKGLYNTRTGKITIILPNNHSIEDVEHTVLHEGVVHYGLRQMFGNNFDRFLDDVFSGVDKATRAKIVDKACTNGWNFHRATEEYLGDMSDSMDWQEKPSLWRRIKNWFLEMLRRCGFSRFLRLSDNDLRYYLWRSREDLRGRRRGVVETAEDIDKQRELGVGDFEEGESSIFRSITREGRQLNEREADELLAQMQEHAEVAPVLELTPENWEKEFGKDNRVNTPIGKVKLGENQYKKLVKNKRELYFGMIKPTLERPDVILEEYDPKEGAERDTKYLFVKTFTKPDGGRVVHFESVTVKKEGLEVSISSHELDGDRVKAKVQNDNILHLSKELSFSSEWRLTETPQREGPDLVPTSDNSSRGKGNNTSETSKGNEENNAGELLYRSGDSEEVAERGNEEAVEKAMSKAVTEQKKAAATLKALAKVKEDNANRAAYHDRAVRQIGASMLSLKQAMSQQRQYDKESVGVLSQLARQMIDAGLIAEPSQREIKRLLSTFPSGVRSMNKQGQAAFAKTVNNLFDIMAASQWRQAQTAFDRALSTKGYTTKSGPKKAVLDDRGNALLDELRASLNSKNNGLAAGIDKDVITTRQWQYGNDIAESEGANAEKATGRYEAMSLLCDYYDDVLRRFTEEADMRREIEETEAARRAGEIDADTARETIASLEDAIRESALERAAALGDITQRLRENLAESRGAINEWQAMQNKRKTDIIRDANADNKRGDHPLSTAVQNHPTRMQKAVNSRLVQFFTSAMPTFDMLFRMYGYNNVNGEGRLWRRFTRQYTEASDKEYREWREATGVLNAKVAKVFGKKGMKWSDMFTTSRRDGNVSVFIYDGNKRDAEGKPIKQEKKLSQGNLAYIYMVNKMTDGKMKLRRMGISEEDVEKIVASLDPRLVELADWLQTDFFPELMERYNVTHRQVYGVSMEDILNYVPLKIQKRAIPQEEDMTTINANDKLPSTMTGSIIQRTRNTLPIDILNADMFGVVADHVRDMSHWMAFAQMNKDLCTLLSYKKFRNQTYNMTTIMGGGERLWERVKTACIIASGNYTPAGDRGGVDAIVTNVAKGVTSAQIALRFYTAFKQLASSTAGLHNSNWGELAKTFANPVGSWRWAMQELPGFSKRWMTRIAGETRLMPTESDWGFWRTNTIQRLQRAGMAANASVDCLTVACMARATYNTKYKQYISEGYPQEDADRMAKSDAAVSYNETQQSTESLYVTRLQLDNTVTSVALSVFNNAPFGYGRQTLLALSNISKMFTPGYRENSIAYMARQHEKQGLGEEQAQRAARKEYRMAWGRNIIAAVNFSLMLPALWQLFSFLPQYLVRKWLGGDDEDKNTVNDITTYGLCHSVDGLVLGKYLGDLAYGVVQEGSIPYYYNNSMLPMLENLENVIGEIGTDRWVALNDAVNLIAMSTVGYNIETLQSMVEGIYNACAQDELTTRDAALMVMSVLNVPRSQRDAVYFDELGLSAKDAEKLTPKEIAERYAIQKAKHQAGWTWLLHTEEQQETAYERALKSANRKAKERAGMYMYDDIRKQYEEYDKEWHDLKKAKGVKSEDDLRKIAVGEAFNSALEKLAKIWLTADNQALAEDMEARMVMLRNRFVEKYADPNATFDDTDKEIADAKEWMEEKKK